MFTGKKNKKIRRVLSRIKITNLYEEELIGFVRDMSFSVFGVKLMQIRLTLDVMSNQIFLNGLNIHSIEDILFFLNPPTRR